MPAARIQIAEVGHLMIDLVKQLDGQLISQLTGDAWQMKGGVGASADCAVYDQGIAESGGRHDVRSLDILFHKRHNHPACLAG